MKDHHPPHIYLDDTWYMITSSTYQRQRLLEHPTHKECVRTQLQVLAKEFKLNIAAWVILDNHYHILGKSRKGNDLSHFVGRLHGRTAFEINGLDQQRGRQVWHNYWDTCIRSDNDYWRRFNYIHQNPVKHGYVQEMEDWSFSSYRYYLEHKGREWLMDAFYRYPIVDFTDSNDAFEITAG